jgi:regulator of sirC expression with transglutaminase-like and TPR domain
MRFHFQKVVRKSLRDMNSGSPTLEPAPLPERQREALISLLADEDPGVYQTVRSKLLEFGPLAGEWLRPHALAGEPILRQRAREILLHLARAASEERFLQFCRNARGELDLEEGAWLLAQTHYPEFNLEAYRALLDSYAAELRSRTDAASSAQANLLAVNQHLFQRLGFAGNDRDYYDPDNSYLNRVVDRRVGNPISLCLLYLLISRRLNLPVTGIGLPGHFVCRYQNSTAEIYIDCFNRGRFLTRADCVRYLVQSRCRPLEDSLAPMSARRLLLRMCANLHQIYLRLELADEAARFQRYLTALAK